MSFLPPILPVNRSRLHVFGRSLQNLVWIQILPKSF